MYNVIVPSKASLEIISELDFRSQKNEAFAERVAVEIDFHLTQTLKYNPGLVLSNLRKLIFITT